MGFLRRGIGLLLAASVLAPFLAGAEPGESLTAPEKALVLGTAPFLEHSLMERYFKPIASYLTRTSGRPVEFVVAQDYAAMLEAAAQGTYDFWMAAPYPGVGENSTLIATASELEIHIITSRRAGIASLEELRGKTIASVAGSPAETMGIRMLEQAGLQVDRDFTLQHAISHDQVVLSVLQGQLEGGITSLDIRRLLHDELDADLLTLATSLPVPALTVMANPGLDPALIRQVQHLLKDFDDSKEAVGAPDGSSGFHFKAVPLDQ